MNLPRKSDISDCNALHVNVPYCDILYNAIRLSYFGEPLYKTCLQQYLYAYIHICMYASP